VEKVNKDYNGYWGQRYHLGADDCYMSLDISEDGDARYFSDTQISDCRHIRSHSGKAKVNTKETVMTVGLKVLEINLKPTRIDTMNIESTAGYGKTAMKMVLNGDTLFKIIGR